MAENKKIIDAAIKALEDYYVENGNNHDLTYTFGFFDALAALREFKKRAASPDFDKSRASAAV